MDPQKHTQRPPGAAAVVDHYIQAVDGNTMAVFVYVSADGRSARVASSRFTYQLSWENLIDLNARVTKTGAGLGNPPGPDR
mmetsp:Transcript_14862/g.28817  ORF Transcript_14862/g.28817 Transcript_14862/m.28817 type:complete len:81 (-) Transcript_14862:332-574(-)